jgi:hypothetical protein
MCGDILVILLGDINIMYASLMTIASSPGYTC